MDALGVEYLEGPLAHQLVWHVLDQAHGMLARERLDEAYTAWDWARRRHGQRMHEWIVYLKKNRLERDARDPDVVSTEQMANEVLPREVRLVHPRKRHKCSSILVAHWIFTASKQYFASCFRFRARYEEGQSEPSRP